MLLCLDIGNTNIVGGVFIDGKIQLKFRYATTMLGTSDQIGVFLYNIFQKNNLNLQKIEAIAVSSVVPRCDFSIRHMATNYFPNANYYKLNYKNIAKLLNIKYHNPKEVGADLLAGAIAAVEIYPNKNLVIVDLGTATTITAVSNKGEFLGGTIMAGLKLAVDSLTKNAAKLTEIDIKIPKNFLGSSTKACIQSGIYFGHIGAIKEIIGGYKKEVFNSNNIKIIATGGFAQLFKNKKIFDKIEYDLILLGLKKAYESR